MAKRRGNGEGSVRLRPDGRWEVTFMVGFNDNGKPKRKSVYSKTQKEVLEKAKQFRDEQSRGLNIDRRLRFSEWADKWYEEYKGSVRDSTYEGYQYTLAHTKRLLGHMPINSIRAIDIEKAIKTLVEEGRSQSAVSKVKGLYHQILRKAEANGLIDKNPVPLTEKTKMPKQQSQKDSFSLIEIGKLFKELPDTRIGHAIRLSIACGLRPQEMLGLSKEYVEPDGNMIHIRQAIYLLKGSVHIGATKSDAGERDIPVPAFAQANAKLLYDNAKTYLLEGENEKPLHPSTYRDYYKSAIGQVDGVRPLTPHCCRHTYITLLELTGAPIKSIQALSGQVDEETTIRYMHKMDEITLKAVDALSGILEGTWSKA